MTKFMYALMGIAFVLCLFSTTAQAIVMPNTTSATTTTVDVSKAHLEKIAGRKLTWRERLTLPLLQKQVKKIMAGIAQKPDEDAKIDGLAVAGFVCGLVGLFVAGILLGLLAIIFSAIALNRISNNPGKRKGRGLAIAGLVLGIVALVGAIIILAK